MKLLALLAGIFASLLLALSLTAIPRVNGYSGARAIYSVNQNGLSLSIYLPYQSYPEETIPLSVRLEAIETIQEVDIHIYVSGAKSLGYSYWEKSISIYHQTLSAGVERWDNSSILIPNDASPGLVYSHTTVAWQSWTSTWYGGYWVAQEAQGIFRAHYVLDAGYLDLQQQYNALQSQYSDLQNQVNDLQTQLSSLRSQNQNTNYLLATIVIVAILLSLATIYFARKPRAKNP